MLLFAAAPLHAQSIADAQRVEFTPSADNNAFAQDGTTPLVQSYTFTVYLPGSSTVVSTANLGKPTPDTDGMMRVNFLPLLTTPLQLGVIYESTVSAVGPAGSSESTRSNTFMLTTTCASTVSMTTQNVAAGASTGSFSVTATCAWASVSNATWLTITSGATGTGNGTVAYSVAANTLTSIRSGTLTVAGNTVTITQAAASGSTVPGAPTAVTGAAGNRQVALSWNAPASNGGSAITGYQVQVSTSATGSFNKAAGCATTSTMTACTATGLTNGTAYFFKVAAINSAGTGSFSSVSSGVTPIAVPGPPTNVIGTAGPSQVALTWTAPASSGGSAISGYQVQVATSPTGPFSNAAGCATTTTTTSCTATGLTNGTTYFFQVAAMNLIGIGSYSSPSSGVTPVATQTTLPTLTIDRTTLNYGATVVFGALTTHTAPQIVQLTQSGSGAVTWTATSSAPWLTVWPSSGTGSAALTISVGGASGLAPFGAVGGDITVTATGTSNNPGSVSVTLLLFSPSSSTAPIGSFDTPTDGMTGGNGSIAVTGWALDDEGVSAVRILRDPVAGEASGQLVMIGNATFVDGARPDVAAANPTRPNRFRAGWGYLALTNMLPSLGNGTFKLYAYADDVDGHSTLLGTKTITCDNANALAPFGAIDTPGQGATVSGVVANFGWVLSRGTTRADPLGGGTVTVVIDGAGAGSPSGWTSRSDLSALFPVAQYGGVNTALGVYSFDSTKMADGVHTISWFVTDSAGNSAGIGSRFFSVFNGNGTSSVVAASISAPVTSNALVAATPTFDTLPTDAVGLSVQRGVAPDGPVTAVAPDATGRLSLTIEELEPVTFNIGGSIPGDYTGYLRGPDGLTRLPIGSWFDGASGQFTWHPGPGFVGRYDFVFVRSVGGNPVAERDVTITVLPKGWLRSPRLVIDAPQGSRPIRGEFLVAGWAFDGRAADGTGIDAVEVWAYPDDATGPIYLGPATIGGSRPDVAALYGERAGSTGYGLIVRPLAAGGYTLAVFGRSTVTGTFLPATTVYINVR